MPPMRKEEYEACGHEVTLQRVNESSDIHAWIDGRAVHLDILIESVSNSWPIQSLIGDEKIHRNDWNTIERIVAIMVDMDLYFCKSCERFYNSDNAVTTGFAGHKCHRCYEQKMSCPDNPHSDSHDMHVTNPSDSHNARVPTRRRCKYCGHQTQTTPTG